jgi:hypothetical protein
MKGGKIMPYEKGQKIKTGSYTYQGFSIERIGTKPPQWSVSGPDSEAHIGCACSLRDAESFIEAITKDDEL